MRTLNGRPRRAGGVVRAGLLAAAVAGAGPLGGEAAAQTRPNGVRMLIDQPVLQPGQSTTIRLEAFFDSDRDFAVAGIGTWLTSTAGSAGLSDPRVLSPMNGPGTIAGRLDETGVRGIIAGQLNFPLSQIFADPSNPIPFWEVTYTAPDDGGGFFVDLETRTSRFDVFVEEMSTRSESRLSDFTEGTGQIHVVPAPAGAVVLAMGLGLAGRRRRGGGVAALRRTAAGAALLGCAGLASGQTTVGGPILVDTTWTRDGNPYRVTETLHVTSGATLTLGFGVRVEFAAGTGLVVGPTAPPFSGTGTLRSLGASGSRSHVELSGGWGVRFEGAATADSVLRRTTISTGDIAAGAFALVIGGQSPALLNVNLSAGGEGSGIFAAPRGRPLAWDSVRISRAAAPGLELDLQDEGGEPHVIADLYVQRVRPGEDVDRAVLVRAGGPLLLTRARFEDTQTAAALSVATGEVELRDPFASDISGAVVEPREDARVRVIDARFSDVKSHVAGPGQAEVLGGQFRRASAPQSLFARQGTTVRGALIEQNAGPVIGDSRTVSAAPVEVRECTFRANTSTVRGGAIVPTLVTDVFDCLFERNSADLGGAIAGTVFRSAGNRYVGNSARLGGAVWVDGPAIMGEPGRPEVFTANSASDAGGGLYVAGRGLDLVAVRSELNTASRGGAIAVGPAGTALEISAPGGTGSVIRANTAALGAAVFVDAAGAGVPIVPVEAPCVDWGTRDAAAVAGMIFDGADTDGRSVVAIDPLGPCDGGCRADFDGDGSLTLFDFLAFLDAFDAQEPRADLDGDGSFTLFDFLAFQSDFDAGCD